MLSFGLASLVQMYIDVIYLALTGNASSWDGSSLMESGSTVVPTDLGDG